MKNQKLNIPDFLLDFLLINDKYYAIVLNAREDLMKKFESAFLKSKESDIKTWMSNLMTHLRQRAKPSTTPDESDPDNQQEARVSYNIWRFWLN